MQYQCHIKDMNSKVKQQQLYGNMVSYLHTPKTHPFGGERRLHSERPPHVPHNLRTTWTTWIGVQKSTQSIMGLIREPTETANSPRVRQKESWLHRPCTMIVRAEWTCGSQTLRQGCWPALQDKETSALPLNPG